MGLRNIGLFGIVYLLMVMAVMGSIVPAGTFGPMLLFGAAIGRFIGEVLHAELLGNHVANFSDPGIYAAIGAACALGAFTRTTIAVVATICEITGDVSLMAPTMASLCMARFFASMVGGPDGFTRLLLSRMLREQPTLGRDLDTSAMRSKPSVIQLLHDTKVRKKLSSPRKVRATPPHGVMVRANEALAEAAKHAGEAPLADAGGKHAHFDDETNFDTHFAHGDSHFAHAGHTEEQKAEETDSEVRLRKISFSLVLDEPHTAHNATKSHDATK